MKLCGKCGVEKPPTEFYKSRGKPAGACKPCFMTQVRTRESRLSVAEKDALRVARRAYNRKAKTGVTPEQYTALFDAQGGVCAVCRKPERVIATNGKVSALAADHCHKTGEARGLLCRRCNAALGFVGDDLAGVAALYRYISQFEFSRQPCPTATAW